MFKDYHGFTSNSPLVIFVQALGIMSSRFASQGVLLKRPPTRVGRLCFFISDLLRHRITLSDYFDDCYVCLVLSPFIVIFSVSRVIVVLSAFIEIEDLTSHFTNPAIMDVKLGTRWVAFEFFKRFACVLSRVISLYI